MNIFYISYDGMTDFVSKSQIIPYLEGLSKRGHEITFLSFEKCKSATEKDASYLRISKEDKIKGILKKYHKRPAIPATVYDILQGVSAGTRVLKNKKINIVHVRGYIAACMGFILKYLFKVKVVFDMRGFWADEKVDAGNWRKDGIIYRVFKGLERFFIAKADEIVVLTEAAKRYILENYSVNTDITVIPCCVDTGLFKTASSVPASDTPGFSDRRIVLYVGSLGSFYNLEEMLIFFKFLKDKDGSFFLRIISGCGKEMIAEKAGLKGISVSDYSAERLDHDDMPAAFSQAEFSLIFYNRKLSGMGCCPIKFAESLASGVPVVINSGIGDCDGIVLNNRIGVVIQDFSRHEFEKAFDAIEGFTKDRRGLSQRCGEVATKLFSLGSGIERYESVYERPGR